jgi:NADP-dependent 3-hydroxy acid dehydrogenase YdfG
LIGLLTNNAGAFAAFGPIWTVDPKTWWRDVETNSRGPFNCCRAALPEMVARKRGRIINMMGGGTEVDPFVRTTVTMILVAAESRPQRRSRCQLLGLRRWREAR